MHNGSRKAFSWNHWYILDKIAYSTNACAHMHISRVTFWNNTALQEQYLKYRQLKYLTCVMRSFHPNLICAWVPLHCLPVCVYMLSSYILARTSSGAPLGRSETSTLSAMHRLGYRPSLQRNTSIVFAYVCKNILSKQASNIFPDKKLCSTLLMFGQWMCEVVINKFIPQNTTLKICNLYSAVCSKVLICVHQTLAVQL